MYEHIHKRGAMLNQGTVVSCFILTIDAMGPQGGGAHTDEEYLVLDSVVPNLQLICEIMKAASENNLP